MECFQGTASTGHTLGSQTETPALISIANPRTWFQPQPWCSSGTWTARSVWLVQAQAFWATIAFSSEPIWTLSRLHALGAFGLRESLLTETTRPTLAYGGAWKMWSPALSWFEYFTASSMLCARLLVRLAWNIGAGTTLGPLGNLHFFSWLDVLDCQGMEQQDECATWLHWLSPSGDDRF